MNLYQGWIYGYKKFRWSTTKFDRKILLAKWNPLKQIEVVLAVEAIEVRWWNWTKAKEKRELVRLKLKQLEEDTLKLQNEYEQAVLSENIWSDAGLITQQREALMQIPISRPAEYMALKEEKSSRSVLATGDTKEVHRPPTIRMDGGRQQPATNYRRTE